jgi:hypothetical protein
MLAPSLYSGLAVVAAILGVGDASPIRSCTVKSGGSNATDDAPAILEAFRACGKGGRVVFEPTTYYVNSVMNVSWLEDVDIDVYGTLLVSWLYHFCISHPSSNTSR